MARFWKRTSNLITKQTQREARKDSSANNLTEAAVVEISKKRSHLIAH